VERDFLLTKVRSPRVSSSLLPFVRFKSFGRVTFCSDGGRLISYKAEGEKGRERERKSERGREMFPAAICLTNAAFYAAIRMGAEFRPGL